MVGTLQGRLLSGYPFPSRAGVSAAMRGNRKRDTRPELRLRSALHALGLRFRANTEISTPGLRVRPDVVFPRHRVAVFLDGCFWHSCRWHGTRPRANTHYWLPKLQRIKHRDKLVNRHLRRDGWVVLRIWEHVPVPRAADLVRKAIVLRLH